MDSELKFEDWTKVGKIVSYARKWGWSIRILSEVLWFHKPPQKVSNSPMSMYANSPYRSYDEHGYVGAMELAFEDIKGMEETAGKDVSDVTIG
jgi:hypothetical protein